MRTGRLSHLETYFYSHFFLSRAVVVVVLKVALVLVVGVDEVVVAHTVVFVIVAVIVVIGGLETPRAGLLGVVERWARREQPVLCSVGA